MWDIDARLGLDRAFFAPTSRNPEAVHAGPIGDGDLFDPLGRRDVAVNARNDEACGEAVADRQWFAVHHEGEHRGAAVVRQRDGESAGEAIDRAAKDLVLGVGRVLNPCFLEKFGQWDAGPNCVADEVASDRVRHAREGDLRGDLFTGEQFLVGVGHRVVDVGAIDGQ